MPHLKTPPPSSDLVRNMEGITFSFDLKQQPSFPMDALSPVNHAKSVYSNASSSPTSSYNGSESKFQSTRKASTRQIHMPMSPRSERRASTIVPLEEAYDLSIKVHDITSEILLFRMGRITPEVGNASYERSSSARSRSQSVNDLRYPLSSVNEAAQIILFSTFSKTHKRTFSTTSAEVTAARQNHRGNHRNSRYVLSNTEESKVSNSSRSEPRRKPYSRGRGRKDSSELDETYGGPAVSTKKTTQKVVSQKASPGRKRNVVHTAVSNGRCIWCGTRKTAQWRKGPTGPRGLCNVLNLEVSGVIYYKNS